jgi:soluble cytochrome b562
MPNVTMMRNMTITEREEFQKVTHTRLNDLEVTMQEKLKNFDQRIHDMEYDIERGEAKRQTDEKKGMDYRMGFDAKIHTLSEKMLEQVRNLPSFLHNISSQTDMCARYIVSHVVMCTHVCRSFRHQYSGNM